MNMAKRRKKLQTLAVTLWLILVLTACGTFKCSLCREEFSGKGIKVPWYGQTGQLCDDCYDLVARTMAVLG